MSSQTKLVVIGALLAVLAIGAPIYFYVKDFHNLSRSPNPSDWASFEIISVGFWAQ
jgi:hypothetical protein